MKTFIVKGDNNYSDSDLRNLCKPLPKQLIGLNAKPVKLASGKVIFLAMTRSDISKLGGQATSKKKARAARQNARKPRPGRAEFNRIVRDLVTRFRKETSFEIYRTGEIVTELQLNYGISCKRATVILETALNRL